MSTGVSRQFFHRLGGENGATRGTIGLPIDQSSLIDPFFCPSVGGSVSPFFWPFLTYFLGRSTCHFLQIYWADAPRCIHVPLLLQSPADLVCLFFFLELPCCTQRVWWLSPSGDKRSNRDPSKVLITLESSHPTAAENGLVLQRDLGGLR